MVDVDFWDYKSNMTEPYRKGYWRVSGYEKMYFYALDGSVSMVGCHYWNEELKQYEGEHITIKFPITTFCEYLLVLKVGVLSVENGTKPLPESKLPHIWNFILATNLKNMK